MKRLLKRIITRNDYEIIDGKPHLGLWFGKYIYLNHEAAWIEDLELNPMQEMAKTCLYNFMNEFTPRDTQNRHVQIIKKPPLSSINPFYIIGTVGIKFMVWGRAFKVMKLNKKCVKRYTRRRISGRVRRVRIDK